MDVSTNFMVNAHCRMSKVAKWGFLRPIEDFSHLMWVCGAVCGQHARSQRLPKPLVTITHERIWPFWAKFPKISEIIAPYSRGHLIPSRALPRPFPIMKPRANIIASPLFDLHTSICNLIPSLIFRPRGAILLSWKLFDNWEQRRLFHFLNRYVSTFTF